ncbi:hypothetical protein BDQ12DRAFT_681154 [Crucibulum laeve]|uniref:Uncharacterized protein n=1 Tax=Crucibulum laeve TaxID=68775 RepID=A0A5C3M3E6_9AGAR|nr:hypothetical protein BDQ12DRAFT_681154 [Crucibulum laeve]
MSFNGTVRRRLLQPLCKLIMDMSQTTSSETLTHTKADTDQALRQLTRYEKVRMITSECFEGGWV